MHLKLNTDHISMTIEDGAVAVSLMPEQIIDGLDAADQIALARTVAALHPAETMDAVMDVWGSADSLRVLGDLLETAKRVRKALEEILELDEIHDPHALGYRKLEFHETREIREAIGA
jgi:hypothetical protein